MLNSSHNKQQTQSMTMAHREDLTASQTSLELLQQEIEWLDSHQYLQAEQFITIFQSTEAAILDPQKKIDRIVPKLVDNLIAKLKTLVRSCLNEAGQVQETLKEIQNKLEEKNEEINTLNDTIEQLNVKISDWQHEYELLKTEATDTQQQYERRLKELKRQKRQIKQTFRMVQENTAIERQLLQNLQVQKQQIHEKVQSEQKEKQELLEELAQTKQKLSQFEIDLVASATKITWEEKRISKLEEIIEQKNQIVDKLMLQLKQGHLMKSTSETSLLDPKLLEDPYAPQKSEMEGRRKSFIQMFKLSDEIQLQNINQDHQNHFKTERARIQASTDRYMKPFEQNQLNKSSVLQNNPADLVHIERQPQPVYPDLYFAHFILTAQTIKLKLNQQELLMIDIKPYYSQILRQRVPFHTWDEWIANKLKEVALRR